MTNTTATEFPIQYGTGWNCCKGHETHVITFDDGPRWAVCTKCANQYPGKVDLLPARPYSAARELAEWTARLEEDRINHARIISFKPVSRVARMHFLAALAAGRKAIVIDKRAIARAAADLSLCDVHITENSCNCIAPF